MEIRVGKAKFVSRAERQQVGCRKGRGKDSRRTWEPSQRKLETEIARESSTPGEGTPELTIEQRETDGTP